MAERDSDLDLMRYADGELSGAETDRVKARVDGDRSARDVVGGVRELGEMVRTRLEVEADRCADQGKFERVWAEIERGIAEPKPAKARAPQPAARPARSGWAAWWDQFHGHVLTGAAAFAAVLIFVIAVRPFERVVERTVQAPAPALPATILTSQPPEIENLEVYQGKGMILTVPGEDGAAPTAVIWLNSNDIAEGPL